jgi:ElaB/YqjD/DUF883 family membrane-anchored ribosome-binding protein
MGGSQSKVTEIDVRNELKMEIENTTKNITKIMNETINTVTTNMVLDTTTEVLQSNAGTTLLEIGDIKQRGRSKININQKVSVKAINSAVLKIVQSNDAMTKLATQFQDQIINKIKNDNEMKGELEAINKIKQLEKDAGGLESLVRNIMDTANNIMKSLTGTSTKEDVKTRIKNEMNLKFKNDTLNQNDIIKKVQNTIQNNMKNVSKQTCKFDTKGESIIRIRNIEQDDNSELTIGQSVAVEALNKCIIDTLNTNGIVQDMSTTGFTTSSSDTANTNKQDAKMKTDNTIVKEKINETAFDFIKQFKDLIVYGGIAIAGVLILYIVIKLISNKGGNNEIDDMISNRRRRSRRRSEEDEDQDQDQRGGLPILETKFLHPLLILISIVFYVFRK